MAPRYYAHNIQSHLKRRQDDAAAKLERWIADLYDAGPVDRKAIDIGISFLTTVINAAEAHIDLLAVQVSAPRDPSPLPIPRAAEGALSSKGAPRRRALSSPTPKTADLGPVGAIRLTTPAGHLPTPSGGGGTRKPSRFDHGELPCSHKAS